MEINILVVLGIILIHWIADFIFQDEQWALNKSKDNFELFKHVATYTLVWIPFGLTYCLFNLDVYDDWDLSAFLSITFILHYCTDWVTSRINKKLYEQKKFGSKIPNFGFFTSIGFDQVLHYIQLFCTYLYLTNN